MQHVAEQISLVLPPLLLCATRKMCCVRGVIRTAFARQRTCNTIMREMLHYFVACISEPLHIIRENTAFHVKHLKAEISMFL